ncbi:MAG: lipopolysaccharide biosynthesis protein [Cyclobacteriaceae bacterium]|nr:lipopolysaccharide biosynthesis protein [Cyclobacteriaceae bacterium]
MGSFKQKAVSGILWSFVQQFGIQFIGFFISILLARLLLPAEFGLIGMITVFIAIGNALVDNGMAASLLRTKDPDKIDYSTVFIANFLTSIVIYAMVFLVAPYISMFYGQPSLTLIIRIYCLSFIISSLTIVQSTRLNKNLEFKKQMLINIPSTIGGGALGVVLAYQGFGVWSLVYMNLFRSVLGTIILWMMSEWRPSMDFNFDRLKIHLNFGYKLTASGLFNSIFSNSYNIVIGKYFSASQLGFYTRAQSLKQLPVENITSALSKVTYPLLASIQDDVPKMKSVYRRLMQQIMFWLTPLMICAIIIAEPLFRFLITDKWLPAVPYFQILCIVGILFPIQHNNLNILKVVGKSGLYLRLEMISNIITILALLLAIPFGIYGLLWGQVGSMLISLSINAYLGGGLIKYTIKEQILDIWLMIFLALLAGSFCYWLNLITIENQISDIYRISILPVIMLSVYLFLAYIFKINAIYEFKHIVLKSNN